VREFETLSDALHCDDILSVHLISIVPNSHQILNIIFNCFIIPKELFVVKVKIKKFNII
jgi:hypothetical protein